MLHVHGEKDQLVLVDHAEEYERARREVAVKSQFVRMPEADHIFTRPEDRQSLLEITADWFENTL